MLHRLLTAALTLGLVCCREAPEPPPLTVVFCLDGAGLDLVDELRAEGELPTLDRLIRTGASGPLRSWAFEPVVSDNLRRGFWSPIVWTTVATGKTPEKHGVQDFVLPLPGTSSV